MYAPYFGLRQEPFSIAPDPRYLYMSERHREALAHLLYGLSCGGGFVLLTGDIGTGKTTVCRAFLEQIPPHCDLAYIFNPKLTVTELLQTICEEFHIETPQLSGTAPTVKDYLDPLNAHLLRAHAAGRQCVLIIDEAQNLSPDVLEQLRLLTNLETSERKLLQIILIGQPELRDMLERPDLEQLAQRVIARYHLLPLDEAETASYVQHRLEVAGLQRVPPFERRAVRRIHRLSRGIPRRINLLCDRALLGAYARSRETVSLPVLEQAAAEVFGERALVRGAGRRVLWGGVVAAAAAGILAAGFWAGTTGKAAWQQLALRAPAKPAPVVATALVQAPASPLAPVSVSPAAAGPAQAESVVTASAFLLRDADVAWRELADQWKVDLPAPGAACPQLARKDVQCFQGNLSLALIRELDRPGIVTLDARSGSPSYALLVRLKDDSATLRAAGTEQTVTLDALAARWQGEFATLWRAPPGCVAEGDIRNMPVLQWAATQLAVGETTRREDLLRSDRELRGRLRSFQLARGLPASGTLTPMTCMQLNRVAGFEEPRLRTDK